MEWQVVIALILAVLLCFIPVAMAWHLYYGSTVHLSHKHRHADRKTPTAKAERLFPL